MIVPNGYNIGRDLLVQNAISGSSWKGISWVTDVEWREGLLEPGFKGIEHASVEMLPLLTLYRNQPCHRARRPYRDLNGPPRLTCYLTISFISNTREVWAIELMVHTIRTFLVIIPMPLPVTQYYCTYSPAVLYSLDVCVISTYVCKSHRHFKCHESLRML